MSRQRGRFDLLDVILMAGQEGGWAVQGCLDTFPHYSDMLLLFCCCLLTFSTLCAPTTTGGTSSPELLLLFTDVQHNMRTYDSRQSCLWSAEQGDQMKTS